MRKWKKWVSVMLAGSMLVSGIPAQSIVKRAGASSLKENGQAEKSIYDKLAFDTTQETEDSERNPYTAGKDDYQNLNPQMELFVEGKISSLFQPILGKSLVNGNYNRSQTDSADLADGTGLNLGWYQGTYQNSGDQTGTLLKSKQRKAVKTTFDSVATGAKEYTALDASGSGYQDYKVCVAQKAADSDELNLYLLSAKTNEPVGTAVNLTKSNTCVSTMKEHETRSYLTVCGGDFDGDGKDEAAVYVPVTDARNGVNASHVDIYDINTESSTKTFEKRSTVYLADLEGTQPGKTLDDSKTPFITSLAVYDFDGDGKEELATSFSHAYFPNARFIPANTKKAKEWKKMGSYLSVLSMKTDSMEEQYGRRLAFTGEEYGIQEKKDTVLQTMQFVGLDVGDMDNDSMQELVVAGYVPDGDDGVGQSVVKSKQAVVQLGFDQEKGCYKLLHGGIPYLLCQPAANQELYEGMWGSDVRQEPAAVACFASRGTGYGDTLFVEGSCWNFSAGASEKEMFRCQYNGGSSDYVVPDEANASGGLAEAYQYQWTDDNGNMKLPIDKDSDTTKCWLSKVVKGNFNGNPYGMEQVIMSCGVKSDSVVSWGLSALSRKAVGAEDTAGYARFTQASGWRDIYLSLAAVDYDEDGMIVKFDHKESYFSDPNVVAVLQAAPYFSDLESTDGNYSTNGSTAYGKTTGSSTTNSAEFSVSAGVITGYEEDVSILGFYDVVGIDFEVEASVSAGYAKEFTNGKSYSTSYEADSTDDSVVLSMTPYTRYVYKSYVPGFKLPTQSRYNGLKKQLEQYKSSYETAEQEYAEIKQKKGISYRFKKAALANRVSVAANRYNNAYSRLQAIDKALEQGYECGQQIAGSWKDYYVSVPQTPRMTMLTVTEYDRVAKENGEFDKIRGNVLTNTPGDPFSYRAAIGASFDGGKVVDDVSGAKDNFVRVSRGGNSITQGIEVESENSDTVTWGTSVETHLVTEEGGVKTGVSAGAEANGSVTWTNYNGAEYSGTVAGIPANVEQSYSFMWRFGTWDTMLNGQRTKVLGYLVKGQEAPPALPSDITVTDATADSLTLSWTHSNRKGVRYRICLLEDNEEETPIAEVSSARSSYTIGNGLLQPGKTYRFTMQSVGYMETSASSLPVYGRTKYAAGTDTPTIELQPEDTAVVEGGKAEFSIYATPVKGSNGSVRYQWQCRQGAGAVWEDIDGADSMDLAVPDVTADMDGWQYRCVVSQFYGKTIEIDSEPAALTLKQRLASVVRMDPLEKTSGRAADVEKVQKEEETRSYEPLKLTVKVTNGNLQVAELKGNVKYFGEYTGNYSVTVGKKITEDAVILEELEGSASDSNYKATVDQIVNAAQSGSFHYLFLRIFKDDATRTKLKNYLSDKGSVRSRENDPETDTLSPNMDLTVEITEENFNHLKYRELTADGYESTVPYDDEYVYGLASGRKTITYTQPVGGEEQTLSAQIVSEEEEPLNGEAVCEIMNLTTGETENTALTVTNGCASGKWTPLGTGYYKLTVKYQGDEEYYGAAAENPQYFTAYNSKKKTLPGVELENTPVYGEEISLQMSLAKTDQVEDVTEATSFTLVGKKDRKRTAITVENGKWAVNELPGEYILEASITKDGVTYECSREVQIEKAQLYVTVDPVTVDVSKTTDYQYQFAAAQLKFRGLSAGDEDAARALFTAGANEQEIGKDSKGKPYAADYSIYTGIKEDAETAEVNELLAKYEVCTINSTLSYTGNKTGSYLVQYGADGSGIVNASTEKGTAIANGGSYAEDSKLYFKAVPAQGWNLKGWKVNGKDAEYVQGITFVNGMLKTALTDDIQVTAVFEDPSASEKPAESAAPTQSPGESSSPVVSGKPQDPTQSPVIPTNKPDTPQISGSPDVPQVSDKPDTPHNSGSPNVPQVSGKPDIPQSPGSTDGTQASSKPNNASATGKDGASADGTQAGKDDGKAAIGMFFMVKGVTYRVTATDQVSCVKAKKNIKGSVVIPDTITYSKVTYKVTALSAGAFRNCKKLTKITIGKNVETIGKDAFRSCKKLKQITIKTEKLTAKSIGKNAFKGIRKNAAIRVPKTQKKSYTKWLKKKGGCSTAKIKA